MNAKAVEDSAEPAWSERLEMQIDYMHRVVAEWEPAPLPPPGPRVPHAWSAR